MPGFFMERFDQKVRAAAAYIVDKKLPAAGVPVPPATGEAGDYAPRVRKTPALAVDEAQRLGHDYVGTEHLLPALAREGEGIAAGLLQLYGALGKVRDFTLAALEERRGVADEAGVTDAPGVNNVLNGGKPV
jgi:ATP-dependent Clp protease ATP-binding subunit ClpA